MASRLNSSNLYNCVLAIIVLLAGSLLAGCTTQSAQPMAAPAVQAMPVKLETATEKIIEDSSTFVAQVKSRKSVDLKPQVEGRILSILVKSGDQVSPGQPIAVLDKSKQEALVNNSEAAIETAVAEKRNAEAMLASLKASRLSKVANLEFAGTQHKRYKSLLTEGAVSAENVDEKRNQLSIHEAELNAIDAQINAQEQQVARGQKLIKQAQAARQEQLEQLKYFTVKAPFAGMIGDVPVKIGDYVKTENMLTSVDQTKPLEVYINIPTALSPRLRLGLTADIVDDTGATIEAGTISFISGHVESDQQTVLVKAALPNAAGRLRSGQTANCRVNWGKMTAVTVPVTAVSRFSGQDFVFVATPGVGSVKFTASQRAVKLGEIEGNAYRVISGVKAGDRVVVSGTQNLADGVPINPS